MSEFERADYMSTGQAARFLGVSPETVRRWVKEGRAPALVTPGGRHLIHRDEVAKLQPAPVDPEK